MQKAAKPTTWQPLHFQGDLKLDEETMMGNVLIIYGSTTGNTEDVATTIKESLEGASHNVTLHNVTDTSVSALEEGFDLYLLGSSTWGADEIEFQEDFDDFYQALMAGVDLKGKSFAFFGCGDSGFARFCGAVDALEAQVAKLGGTQVCPSLRVDGDPEEDEVAAWAAGLVNAL